MKGINVILGCLAVLVLCIVSFQARGLEETTIDLTIEPGERDGEYLPQLDGDTIDVKMTSDVPVDVYIITYDEAIKMENGSDFEYEKKWEGETSLDVDYTVEDQEQMYFLMVENPSESETAHVELEYKLYEELAEEAAEDAAEEVCFGTIIAGLMAIGAIVAAAMFIKKMH